MFMTPYLHRFATSKLRKFMIPDLHRFATSGLRRFKIPDLHRFTTSGLRRFKIPNLHRFNHTENLFHEFRQTRRFEGDGFFLNSPSTTMRIVFFYLFLATDLWRRFSPPKVRWHDK
jgi:hypothetical protein